MEHKHDWIHVDAIARDKDEELSFGVCLSCGRATLDIRGPIRGPYYSPERKEATVILREGDPK